MLFAPLTVVDAYDRFRAIAMLVQGNNFSIEAVLGYNQAYAQLYKLCPEDARPSDYKLRELYLRNLRPQRLAHCVGLRDPETLADARKFAVQEVKKLHSMQSILAGAAVASGSHGSGGAVYQNVATGSGLSSETRQASTGRGFDSSGGLKSPAVHSIICHSCGARGHKSFECPDRAHSGAASTAPGSSSLPPRAGVPRGIPLGAPVTRSSTGSLTPKKTFTLAAAVGSEVGSEVVQSDAPRDRKSTRLNSSH